MKIFAILCMIGLLSGCATMRVETYYPDGKFPAKTPQEVKIFYTDPPRPYQVLGAASGVVPGSLSWNDNSKKLKEQAAAAGADAIVCLDKQGNCHEVVVRPEETVVKEKSQQETSAASSEQKGTEVLTRKPAEFKTECDTWTDCKMVRFTD